MADPIVFKQFQLPLYKGNGSGNLIEVGDTLNLRKSSQTWDTSKGDVVLSLQAQAVTLTHVNDTADIVGWANSSANGFTLPTQVYDVDPDHVWNCPAAVNLTGSVAATVTSITVNGVANSGLSFAVNAGGATAAEAWLNDYIRNTLGIPNVYATVELDTAANPDELIFYVNNFDGSVTVNATALAPA